MSLSLAQDSQHKLAFLLALSSLYAHAYIYICSYIRIYMCVERSMCIRQDLEIESIGSIPGFPLGIEIVTKGMHALLNHKRYT